LLEASFAFAPISSASGTSPSAYGICAALASASPFSLSELASTPSLRSVNLAYLPVRLLVFPLLQLSFAHWFCPCCFVGLLGVLLLLRGPLSSSFAAVACSFASFA
jgi:hypothetical protein